MKSASFIFLVLACTLVAQEAPVKPPEKRQDPEALKLIERFDSLFYVARAAGLNDLEFTTKLPSGHNLVIKWKAPDKIKADLTVPADIAPETARRLELVIPRFQGDARRSAPSFVDSVIGEVLRDKHRDDDVILVAPNQVRIVARSESSKASVKEQTLTFDEQGMIKLAKVIAPTGAESTMEPTFSPANGKFVYHTVKTKIGASAQDSIVTYDYAVHEGITLVKKVTISSKAGGKVNENVLEFFDVKVNRGIDDKVFEVKPAEPKQGGG